MSSGVDIGPKLLLDWRQSEDSHFLQAGAGSVAIHILLFGLLVWLAGLDTGRTANSGAIAANLRKITPLVAPPAELTQKAPNKGKVSKEVNVEDLKPRPPSTERLPPAPATRAFQPPRPQNPAPPQPAARMTEPPKLDTPTDAPPAPPAAGSPQAPPPQIQSEEKPKLAFQTPGQRGTAAQKSPSLAKIVPPKTTVDEAIRSVAHGGGQGGVVVGDLDQPPLLSDTMRLPPSPAKTGSSLELLSDPMGVDFKPYLIRILATVRRNWFAVIPESARLGTRGLVQLQFVIDRSGQVPKLVIAMPSGSEALDRAAVAGISASVPFPPLPQEFKGREIRLQFSFKYNLR